MKNSQTKARKYIVTQTFSLYLDDLEALYAYAEKEQINKSAAVRKAIQHFLAQEGK